MPTNTYVALDRVTLTSSVTSITLNMGSTLSQAYTDLVLVANTIIPTGATFPECSLRFNGDTGSNYSNTYLLGLGSNPAVSGRGSNYTYADCGYLTTNSGKPNTRIINIMNYSNTTTNKTVLVRGSSDNGGQVIAYANLWRNTAAITSITVFTQGGTYAAGSTFSLYGISNAGDATPKATGGDVTSDATYWYHTFTMSGNFVPNQTLSCDYVLVAGGGGGGADGGRGGGGGAGGFRSLASQTLTAQTYQVLVGAGGIGGAPNSNGTNSSLGSTSATGGGRGGTGPTGSNPNGASGGSGGGAIAYYSASPGSGNAGAYSPVEGYAGGNNGGVGNYGAGGGGGAGAVGNTASGNNAADGGVGALSSINGNSTYYAGGGAGGGTTNSASGGLGGGGSWNNSTNIASSGTVNTGGGGAGGGGSSGGNGGSGIVIVRYLKA